MFVAATIALGCGDSSGPASVAIGKLGALEINVTTQGAIADVDPDGYSVSIDDGPVHAIARSGAVKLGSLSVGAHLVRLDGLAPNCSVSGVNPLSVNVPTGGVGVANFLVTCIARLGTVRISTTTSGENLDGDGYTWAVGLITGNIPANGTSTVTNVPAGQVVVALSGIDAGCAVQGSNPRSVTVPSTEAIEVPFAVVCVPRSRVEFTVTTTGTDVDLDGYDVIGFPQTGSFRLPPNGHVAVGHLLPGTHTLVLQGIGANCDLSGSNPRLVTLVSGSTTTVTLDIKCDAARQLAFVYGEGTSTEVYVINSNGTGFTRLTSNTAADVDPAWSPDGNTIAFASERDGGFEIYAMSANGSNPRRLTTAHGSDFRPTWSPDGSRIAFVSDRDGNAEIYVMNADGSNPIRLTNENAYDGDPAWSPDGTRIAFFRSGRGFTGPQPTDGLWLMNADGSNPTRLTSNSLTDSQPTWSPDGTWIAFSRGTTTSSRAIAVINRDGSGLKSITEQLDGAADPSWSADGRKIAFSRTSCYYPYYYYSQASCDTKLAIISTNGIAYAEVTSLSPVHNPAWRP